MEPLTPVQIEAVLGRFRTWLRDMGAASPVTPEPTETVDLHTLTGHFIALRQEINLQTRANRSALEQNAETLRQVEELAQRSARTSEAARTSNDDQLRPLLKAVVDTFDALTLASEQVDRLRDSILPHLETLEEAHEWEPLPELPEAVSESPAARGWLSRVLGRGSPRSDAAGHALADWIEKVQSMLEDRLEQARDSVEYIRQALDSVVTGYALSLNRIERILPLFGVEPILAEGQRFDPDSMEVVEAVDDSENLPGEVVDEVRRGYRWRGQIFRYAQVRVAR